MLQQIEYARRHALAAREKANQCINNVEREGWEKAADMWDALAAQYELLRRAGETVLELDERGSGPVPAAT